MPNEYRVYYYVNSRNKKIPVKTYIKRLTSKERIKIFGYINFLQERKGYLGEPYARHIKGKIRELRVDFVRNRHRIFYFTFVGKKIILLHAFLKKTQETPMTEIERAQYNYQDFINNPAITLKKYD